MMEARIKNIWRNLFCNKFFYLVFLLVVSRLFIIKVIDTVPPMEQSYFNLAQQFFESSKRFDFYFSSGYSVLLYAVDVIFHNWKLSTQVIYVFFSVGIALVFYQFSKTLFDKKTALYSLMITIFLPNLTAAVAGYSHSVVVSLFFLCLSFYFFLLILRKQKIIYSIIFSLFMLAATLIRADNVIYFIIFILIYLVVIIRQHKKRLPILSLFILGIGVILYFIGLKIQYHLIQPRSSTNYLTLFGNKRYSYETYITTFSLRATGSYDARLDRKLSSVAFGTPEENQYSIMKAVMKNPLEVTKNIIFNLKTLLKDLGHPLFMPCFLYPFVGLGLFSTAWNDTWKKHFFLSSLFIPTLATLLFFHVEIRYMSSMVLPLVIWIALGIQRLPERIKKPVVITLIAILVCLFVAYSFQMRISGQN